MPTDNKDAVNYKIYLDAVDALRELDKVTQKARSIGGIMDETSRAVQNFANKSGLSLTQVGNVFEKILRQGQQLRDYLAKSDMGISNLPNDLRKIAGVNLFSGKSMLNEKNNILLENGIGLRGGLREMWANIKEVQMGMAQTNVEAAKLDANMSKAAESAALMATYNKQGFQKLDFSNIANYKTNVQSLMTGISNVSKETGARIEDVGKYIQQTFTNVPKVAVTDAIKGLNKELQGTSAAGERAAKGIDAARIALGALVAMVVFQAIQALGNFFREVIKGATDLEMAFYRLAKVERSLSKAGVDITPKGLMEGIKEIKQQFDFLSEVDITKLLGNVSLLTKELKLSERQIIDLSKAIINLNINSQENEDVLQTSSKVITAMITGQARGVSTLGLSFSDTTLEAKALEMGILKAGESMSKLTDEQKGQVKLAVAFDTAGLNDLTQMLKDSAAYSNTLEGSTNDLKNAWEDFTAAIGTSASPVIKEFLQEMATSIKAFLAALEAAKPTISSFFTFVAAWLKTTQDRFGLFGQYLGSVFTGDLKSAAAEAAQFLSKMNPVSFADDWKKNYMDMLDVASTDTPTNSTNSLSDALLNLQESLKNVDFEDFIKDLADLQEKMREAEEEFNTDQLRELQDYNLERVRDAEDHLREEQEIVEDAAQKRHDAEQKYRDKEKEAEARFQERMRQLREKFLYNLEDALRDRDARQILRLIREYQMEKKNLTNEEAIRKEFAAKEHAEEMERMRQEEADRLAELDEEFAIQQQRKAEDFALKQARAAEDHAKEMEDLRTQMDERMKEFSDKLAEELGLREGAADDIYKLLKDYYGEGGKFDQLYAYSAESMIAYTQAMVDALSSYLGQVQGLASTIPGGGLNTYPITPPPYSGGGTGDRRGHARGGTFIATSPTQAIFGEAGRERVTFTPTKDMNQMGMGGRATVTIRLMDGLKADIVDSALNDMAIVIEQVQRSMA